MKTIKTHAIITGLRSKVDRSLGLTIATPELSPAEKAEMMTLQGINVDLTIKPLDKEPTETYEVKKEMGSKTQAQRIRAVIYLLWKQDGEKGDLDTYYREKTEKYISFLKEKLEE